MLNEETPILTFTVSPEDQEKRLDAYLSEKIEGWSRSRLKKLIDAGDVSVNAKPPKSSYKLRENDEIEIELSETYVDKFEPEDIPLDIIFEDEYLAVINKPAGMVVHPASGIARGTLANAIAYHFKFRDPENAKDNRVGIVHRLDKDTSGLILVAKSEDMQEKLSEQFRQREVFKQYAALVHGYMKEDTGRIEEPIGRDRKNRVKMAVTKNGRDALTLLRVKERFDNFTLLDVEIKTGRTHQIRVHLAHIRHGVVADEVYNAGRDNTVQSAYLKKKIKDLGRFFLHAGKLAFKHPVSGKMLEFQCNVPPELNDFLEEIRKQ